MTNPLWGGNRTRKSTIDAKICAFYHEHKYCIVGIKTESGKPHQERKNEEMLLMYFHIKIYIYIYVFQSF